MGMMTGSGVRLQLAQPGDVEEIARLLPDLAGPHFAERFPGRTAAEFCHWKYFTNPLGEAAVAIATDGGRVVSLVAGVPKRVRMGPGVQLAFELGDFITAPEYRKRGLFSSLIQLTCDDAAKRDAAFVYVRPNPISFRLLVPGLRFLEVQKLDLRRYIVPSGLIHRKTGIPAAAIRGLGMDWIAQQVALPAPDPAVTVAPVTRFGEDFDNFWAGVEQRYSWTLARDSQYLNWRYVDSPTPFRTWMAVRKGRPAGYITAFVSQEEPLAQIVDLFTDPDDEAAAATLLRSCLEAMLAAGAQVFYTWTPQSGGESASTRLLKRVCRWNSKPYLHVALRFVGAHADSGVLPSSGWHIAMGDFDGI
jgi:hypothetical protein